MTHEQRKELERLLTELLSARVAKYEAVEHGVKSKQWNDAYDVYESAYEQIIAFVDRLAVPQAALDVAVKALECVQHGPPQCNPHVTVTKALSEIQAIMKGATKGEK